MIWFTSDWHLNHANIIKFCERPYDDVHEMNKVLVDNWNQVVSPDDTGIFVGDIAMGNFVKTLKWVNTLNGHKILIPGNHDKVGSHRGNNANKYLTEYQSVGFTVLPHVVTLKLPQLDEAILVCHYPYRGDSGEIERYTELRPKDEGQWLIHGHMHSYDPVANIDQRMIDVGVDANGDAPVSADTLATWIHDG